jgi:hypothetical protein
MCRTDDTYARVGRHVSRNHLASPEMGWLQVLRHLSNVKIKAFVFTSDVYRMTKIAPKRFQLALRLIASQARLFVRRT